MLITSQTKAARAISDFCTGKFKQLVRLFVQKKILKGEYGT
jgi:hypothetical protein